MRILRQVAALGVLCGVAVAQGEAKVSASAGKVVFTFAPKDPGRKPFEIEVAQDGSGMLRYPGVQPAEQVMTVSTGTLERVNKAADAVSENRCETKVKHIAQTGKKTLSFGTGPALSTCTFNYSDDADVNAAASAFLGMQQTIEMGAELARLHRFDRLGLDAEMEALSKAVEDHFAIEVGNIAPVLQSLVDDDRVMERVRRKAARLLEEAGGTKTAGS